MARHRSLLLLTFATFLTPPIPGQEQSGARGRILGRVLDDIRGSGLSQVRITLTGTGTPTPTVFVSTDDGAFSFLELSAGKYRLALEKVGFFPQALDSIELRTSMPLRLDDIRLVAKRTIDGSVLWDDGEPVVDVYVQVFPVEGGKPAPARGMVGSAGLGDKPDRGTFRVSELRPGRYAVVAYTARFNSSDDSLQVGLPVFYPGSDSAAGATLIDLRGNVSSSISLTLKERPGVVVSGTVLPSASYPIGLKVSLGLIAEGTYTYPIARTEVVVGRRFRFTGIPDGRYVLMLSTVAGSDLLRASRLLIVRGAPLTDFDIQAPEAIPIVGRCEFDGGLPAPGVRVTAQNPDLGRFGVSGGTADKNGEFQLKGSIEPGKTYSLQLLGLGPPNAYVASVRQGTSVMTKSPFSVVASREPVLITLKTDGGAVRGVARARSGGAASSAFVVLAPVDRTDVDRFRAAQTDSTGMFSFNGVAPGSYHLFAIDQDQEHSYLTEEYLRPFSSHAVSLEVGANTTVSTEAEIIITGSEL